MGTSKITLKNLFYSVIFIAIITLIIIGINKRKNNFIIKQKEITQEFVNLNFTGHITKYEKVPRGMHLWVNQEYYLLGESGSILSNHIAIGDSIVKKKGSEEFVVYKKDSNGRITDKIVVETGYTNR